MVRLISTLLGASLVCSAALAQDGAPPPPLEWTSELALQAEELLRFGGQATRIDLAAVEQQLAGPLGFMVEAVAVAEFGNVGIDQPYLAAPDLGIAFRNRPFPETKAFHFRTGQGDPGFEGVIDMIVKTRAAVLGDGLLLVEGSGFGSNHGRAHVGAGMRQGKARRTWAGNRASTSLNLRSGRLA